jgi:hypothetical protein
MENDQKAACHCLMSVVESNREDRTDKDAPYDGDDVMKERDTLQGGGGRWGGIFIGDLSCA